MMTWQEERDQWQLRCLQVSLEQDKEQAQEREQGAAAQAWGWRPRLLPPKSQRGGLLLRALLQKVGIAISPLSSGSTDITTRAFWLLYLIDLCDKKLHDVTANPFCNVNKKIE